MISFDRAFEMMMSVARPLGTETVPLREACGRVLAQDVVCDVDMPPFDRAAMDGFACRSEDAERDLEIIEEIPAGYVPRKVIGPGQCARIMTGAPVPVGADRVVMVEESKPGGEGRIRVDGARRASNISPKGEDVKIGDVVLCRGTILTGARMGVLCAAIGKPGVLVYRRAKVGLLATGDELVEPWEQPPPAGIRNTNSHQLSAQIHVMGAVAVYHGIVADRREELLAAARRAGAESDVLLVSGGVSAGVYDFVPGVLEEAGYRLLFQGVAMQPGKPLVFGTGSGGVCCGMPGNPVATFVVFELMLKPFLYALMGHEYKARVIPAELESDVTLKRTGRQTTIPVVFTATGKVKLMEYHGSAHLHAIASADGLLVVPADTVELKKGSTVHVRPI